MKETVDVAVTYMTSILQTFGPFSGILLVLLESIIPVLPLGVFITLNINAFGFLFGFLLSWMATCIGCILSFYLFRFWFQDRFFRLLKKKKAKHLKETIAKISKIPFSNLVVLIALPFTPAFLINIAAGLSKMSSEKFVIAILLGKISIVYFWGYIGKSILESVTDIKTIITVSFMLLIAYFLSKLVGKKLKIE